MSWNVWIDLCTANNNESQRAVAFNKITEFCSQSDENSIALCQQHPEVLKTALEGTEVTAGLVVNSAAIQLIRNICRPVENSAYLLQHRVTTELLRLVEVDSALLQFFAVQSIRCLVANKCAAIIDEFIRENGVSKVISLGMCSRYLRFPDGKTLWVHIEAARLLCLLTQTIDMQSQVGAEFVAKRGYKPILEHVATSTHQLMRQESINAIYAIAPSLGGRWPDMMEHDRNLVVQSLARFVADDDSSLSAPAVAVITTLQSTLGWQALLANTDQAVHQMLAKGLPEPQKQSLMANICN